MRRPILLQYLILLLCISIIIPKVTVADINCVSDAMGCCCIGTVGNVDCDFSDQVDIGDLTRLIDYLFISLQALPSWEEANIDGDPQGTIDIGDLTLLIDYLFISQTPLISCPGPFNKPPETRISGLSSTFEYINAVAEGSPVTGVPIKWEGSDLVDHPYSSPPFKYEWRIYGPYAYNETSNPFNDTTFEYIEENFIKTVFVRNNGDVFVQGQGETFEDCDTTPWGIICNTILVDTLQFSSPIGILDTILDIADPNFVFNPLFNTITIQSSSPNSDLVFDDNAIIYDLFQSYISDSTIQMKFIFWVRSADPVDTTIFDVTPSYQSFEVIDPKFEHDISVLDVQFSFQVNGLKSDTLKTYWDQAITDWELTLGSSIDWDVNRDYIIISGPLGLTETLKDLLSYKTIIIANDHTFAGSIVTPEFSTYVNTAIDAGVSIWMCGRNNFFGSESQSKTNDVFSILHPTVNNLINSKYGITNSVYSSWGHSILLDSERIEDFSGIISEDNLTWPDLDIDTTNLHSRYFWKDYYPWIDTIASLPEVNYYTVIPEVELMYTYKSLYGAEHWHPDPFYNFHGNPVMHRFETSWFRTVFSMFTPLAFDDTQIQPLVNNVLDWLYAPWLVSPVSASIKEHRFPNAKTTIDKEKLRSDYLDRIIKHNEAEKTLSPVVLSEGR